MVRQYREYTNEDIILSVKESFSVTQVIRKLGLRPAGGTHKVIKNKIKELDLDTTHFGTQSYNFNKYKEPLSFYLKKDVVVKSTYLKKRLIREGLIDNKCSKCGQLPIWNNEPLTLELDHIDGDIYNNELSNLRILCLHCHSQTSTFRRRKIIPKILFYCDSCGKSTKKKSKTGLCSSCFNRTRDYSNVEKKVKNRPSKEQLLKEVKDTNYCAVGRKYGVSDTCIRKWLE